MENYNNSNSILSVLENYTLDDPEDMMKQKGPIAFESLIKLAMTLGYTSEIKDLFSKPKFDTMEELDLIRKKSNDKRAYSKGKKA